MEPDEARLREGLKQFPPEMRLMLLDILSSDDETRAAKIGELHQAGGAVAELLIDIEEDPVILLTMRSMLTVMEAG